MKPTLRSLMLAVLAMVSVSCLRDPASEASQSLVLKSDVQSIVVEADTPGSMEQERSVQLSCNRSWSAFFEPAVDWITLSVSESENIARTEETTVITMSFANNEDYTQERSTSLVVSTAEGRIKIPISQGKQVPYINLITPARVEDVACMEDVSVVRFQSNIQWKARIEEGATAQVSLDKSSGKYDGEIAVTFAENLDVDLSPEAVLILDGTESGLESIVKVYFKQGQAAPYIRWISEEQTYASSWAGSLDLEFKTNSNWTASIKDSPEGLSIAPASGTKDTHSLKLSFGDFYGLGTTRTATIELALSSGENASLNVTQQGNVLFLDFANGNQPFTTAIEEGTMVTNETEYTLSQDGTDYSFVFYAQGGYTYINKPEGQTCGVNFTPNDKNSWIKFPGVNGKKLVNVKVFMSNMSSSANKGFYLREDSPTNTANQAQNWNFAPQGFWGAIAPKSPEAGKSYYLVGGNKSIIFSKLALEFE